MAGRINRQPSLAFLDGRYVNVVGDSMTGSLTITVDSASALLVETAGGTDIFEIDTNTPLIDCKATNITTTGTIDCTEIFNSNGDLKIMPDVQGDAIFFGDTDVGNAAVGKSLIISRKAAEFDRTQAMYFDAGGSFHFAANGGNLWFDSGSANTYFNANHAAAQFVIQSTGGTLVNFGARSDLAQSYWGTQAAVDNQFNLTIWNNTGRNTDHPDKTDPWFYIQSRLNADTSNNQWGGMGWDTDGFVIETGVNVGTGTGATTNDNYISFKPRGVEQMVLSGAGDLSLNTGSFSVPAGQKVIFEGAAGDTYFIYQNGRLELFVNNTLVETWNET